MAIKSSEVSGWDYGPCQPGFGLGLRKALEVNHFVSGCMPLVRAESLGFLTS